MPSRHGVPSRALRQPRAESEDRDRPPLRHADEAVAGHARGDGERRGRRRAAARGSDRARARGARPRRSSARRRSVYLPTATMANQIALAILGRRGTELIVEETAHIMISELGGAAMHSGLQTRGLPGYRGRLSPEQVSAAVRAVATASTPRARRSSRSRTRTTAPAAASGRSRSSPRSSRPRASSGSPCTSTARGSRTRRSRSACRRPRSAAFDTVTLCLSKGLGCPLGAVIAGSRELMARARVEKHRFGGAMRQAGIVAAAGALRARAQRRAARRRPRARAPARRGLGRARRRRSTRPRRDELRPGRRRRARPHLGRGDRAARRRRRRPARPSSRACSAPSRTSTSTTTTSSARSSSSRAPSVSSPAPDGLAQRLERTLRARQAERLPSVVGGGRPRRRDRLGRGRSGTADYEDETEATPETQYRIGSITKTFTAVAMMQLRDAGKLDLDDRLERAPRRARDGSPTLRRLLAHLSGLQREPGEMWVSRKVPTIEELLAAMRAYELVLPPLRGAPLLEPRLCAARRGRRAPGRPSVHRVRRQPDPRPLGLRARPGSSRRHARRATSSTSTPARRARAAHRLARRRCDGAALVDGRRPVRAGPRCSPKGAKACSTRRRSRRCGSRR